MSILNLTQHAASPAQVAAGVVEPEHFGIEKATVQALLTFPAKDIHGLRLKDAAVRLVKLMRDNGVTEAMIGGLPALMLPLQAEMSFWAIQPNFAISERVSEDKVMPDGSTRKVAVFRHLGWHKPDNSWFADYCEAANGRLEIPA